MTNTFTSITINSQTYNENQLASLCLSKLATGLFSSWEYNLYTFILDWISSNETITVNTSGSTDKPRQIIIEKRKMIQSALLTGNFLILKKKDKALLSLPVDFIAGKMLVIRAFVLGLNLITIEPTGNPLSTLEGIYEFAAFTPMQVFNILKEERGVQKLNNIKNVIIGGGSISLDLNNKLQTFENNIFHTYGMTETITHIAARKLTGKDKHKHFKALKGVQFDTDERSCLTIMAEHLSDEKIITNDIVELKSKTEFEFIGRLDNIINSGGIKIFPEKVEQSLGTFFSQRFIVSGIFDQKLGQKVVIVVEGDEIMELNIKEICIKAGLTKFEIPKKVVFIKKFPETNNGKIIRAQIQSMIT